MNQNEFVNLEQELPYELAQFETHLRQPVRLHNIRKRMQQDSSEQIAVNENGENVDAILVFAQKQHLFAEGPDFLLSDALLFPLFYLMQPYINCKTFSQILPKTQAWFDRVKAQSLDTCAKFLMLPSLQESRPASNVVSSMTWIWPQSVEVPNQSLYKSDPKRLNPSARIFTRQQDIDRAMKMIQEAQIEVQYFLELTALCIVDFFPSICFIPTHLELHASLEKLTKLW